MRLGREILPGELGFRQNLISKGYKPNYVEALVKHYYSRLKAGEDINLILQDLSQNPPQIETLETAAEAVAAQGQPQPSHETAIMATRQETAFEQNKPKDETSFPAPVPSEERPKLNRQQAFEDFKASQKEQPKQPSDLEKDFAAPKTAEYSNLEREVSQLKGAVGFLEAKLKVQEDYNNQLDDELHINDAERDFFKTLVNSALAHTDLGALLVIERKSLREELHAKDKAEQDGKPKSEVLWQDEKGNPIVYSSAHEAEDKGLQPLQRREMQLKEKKASLNTEAQKDVATELFGIIDKKNRLKMRIDEAPDSIIYPSVLESEGLDRVTHTIQQDQSVVQEINIDKAGEVAGAERLKRMPRQISVQRAKLMLSGLDLRIIRYYSGGMVAKHASEKLGKKVVWNEKTGLNLTDKELEVYAKQGLELQVENAQLKTTVEHDRRKIKDLEKKLSPLEDQIEELAKENESLKDSAASLKAENEKSRKAQEEYERKLSVLEQRIKDYDSKVFDLEQQKAIATADAEKTKQEYGDFKRGEPARIAAAKEEGMEEAATKAAVHTQVELAKRDRALKKIEEDATTSKSAKERLEVAIRSRTAQYEAELAKSDAENQELKEKYKKAKARNAELESILLDKDLRIAKSKEKLDKANNDIGERDKAIAQLNSDKTGLAYENSELSKRPTQEEYDGGIKAKDEVIQGLTEKINGLLAEGAKKETTIKELSERPTREEYDNDIKARDTNIGELKTINANLDIQIEELKKRPTQTQYDDDIKARDTNIGELRKTISSLELQIKELKKRPTEEDVQKRLEELSRQYEAAVDTFSNIILEEWIPIDEAEHEIDLHVTLSNNYLLEMKNAELKAKDDELKSRPTREEYAQGIMKALNISKEGINLDDPEAVAELIKSFSREGAAEGSNFDKIKDMLKKAKKSETVDVYTRLVGHMRTANPAYFREAFSGLEGFKDICDKYGKGNDEELDSQIASRISEKNLAERLIGVYDSLVSKSDEVDRRSKAAEKFERAQNLLVERLAEIMGNERRHSTKKFAMGHLYKACIGLGKGYSKHLGGDNEQNRAADLALAKIYFSSEEGINKLLSRYDISLKRDNSAKSKVVNQDYKTIHQLEDKEKVKV